MSLKVFTGSFILALVLYSIADTYEGLSSSKALFEYMDLLIVYLCNILCSMTLCVFLPLAHKNLNSMKELEAWNGFMTGILLKFLCDQGSRLLMLPSSQILIAMSALVIFVILFVKVAFKAHTLKKRFMLICLVFAAFSAKTSVITETKPTPQKNGFVAI